MLNQNNPDFKITAETGYIAQDPNRPQPAIVSPGEQCTAPSDAIVLFDGSHLEKWESVDGGPAPWKVENGYTEVVPQSRNIVTKQTFGDVQLHLEFASPAEVKGQGQGRGNSGVFFHDSYEVQILDNYQNETYPDGTVGAIYSQHPPLVNAMRAPGEWNTYDILWQAPVFEGERLTKRAHITVLFNNVLVQNHTEILGRTLIRKGELPYYQPHPPKGRIMLQDHKDLVRFRNIWVREL